MSETTRNPQPLPLGRVQQSNIPTTKGDAVLTEPGHTTPRSERPSAPRWVCSSCRRTVKGKGAQGGWLSIRYTDIALATNARKLWDQDHAGQTVFSGADLFGLPEPAQWSVYHRKCDPDPEASSYWIDVERIRTWRSVVSWWAHLSEKAWLGDTNWGEFAGYGAGCGPT